MDSCLNWVEVMFMTTKVTSLLNSKENDYRVSPESSEINIALPIFLLHRTFNVRLSSRSALDTISVEYCCEDWDWKVANKAECPEAEDSDIVFCPLLFHACKLNMKQKKARQSVSRLSVYLRTQDLNKNEKW